MHTPIDGLHRAWRCELDDGTALFEARVPDRLVGAPLAGPWCLLGTVKEDAGRLELLVEEASPLHLDGGGASTAGNDAVPAGA